jgi:hypothetical protein
MVDNIDNMIIEHGGKTFDIRAMDRGELLLLKISIESDIDAIKSQIREAQNRVAVEHEYADRDWYRRANDAAKIKGRQGQLIQARLGILKQQEREARLSSLPRRFMDAAYELLDLETYQRINDEAHAALRREGLLED